MRHLLAIFLFVTVTACNAERAQIPDHNPTVIATYEVPAATENQVESVINSLLGVGEDGERIGRARVLPNRLIVVSAPATVQPGIERFIKQLWDTPPAAAQRIRLHYWLVRGTPASNNEIAESLGAIGSALQDLAENAGTMQFEKLDYVTHTLRSGASAGVEGGMIGGHVDAASRGARIAVDLSLNAPQIRASVRSQMDLNDGETVVLAQMGDNSRKDEESDAVNLFVIRAENF